MSGEGPHSSRLLLGRMVADKLSHFGAKDGHGKYPTEPAQYGSSAMARGRVHCFWDETELKRAAFVTAPLCPLLLHDTAERKTGEIMH